MTFLWRFQTKRIDCAPEIAIESGDSGVKSGSDGRQDYKESACTRWKRTRLKLTLSLLWCLQAERIERAAQLAFQGADSSIKGSGDWCEDYSEASATAKVSAMFTYAGA